MKLFLRKNLVFTLAFWTALAAGAATYPETVEVDGILYRIVGNGEATCLGPNGDHASFSAHNLELKDYVLFSDSQYPHRVGDVAAQAFDGCVNITGDLIIPDTYRNIHKAAFKDCTGFNGILKLSPNLITLAESAFQNCSGFKGDLTLPGKIVINKYVFDGCSGFDGKLTLPDNSTDPYIWEGAFRGCSGLTGSIEIPDNIKYISEFAFQNCSNLDGTLTLSPNTTSVGQYAFANCTKLHGELVIPSSVISLLYHVFENCTGFDKLTLEPGVKGLYQYAFAGCTGFKGDLYIPESVTTLDSRTFYHCTGFDGTLTLSPNTKLINASCFEGCTGFKGTLVVPEGVESLWASVFKGCTGFTGVSLPNSLTNIQSSVFEGCSGLTGDLILPSNLTTLGNSVFLDCSSLDGRVVVPESLTEIGYEVFQNCSAVKEFVLHDDITSISWYAFKNTTGKISLPKNLQTTSTETFFGCTGLQGDLILPASLTAIGNRCFMNTGLTGVVVPDELSDDCTFGVGAFANLSTLKWVIILKDNPLPLVNEFTTLNATGGGLQLSANYPVYVHSQAVEAFKETAAGYDKIYPILVVDDIDLEVNGTTTVTYRYQPDLSPETHASLLALSKPHKGSNIAWSATDKSASDLMAANAAESTVVDFDSDALTLKAVKGGSALIEANDGVNIARATVKVTEPTPAEPEQCDCCQPGDSNASVRDRIFMIPNEETDLAQLLGDLVATTWTCTDDETVSVSDAGVAHANEYGEAYVRAKDADGATIAVIYISVCPTVTVQHGAGVIYTHHVPYNTRPTLILAPGGGYKLAGVTHDGADITDNLIAADGKYVPQTAITDNSVINLALENDSSNEPTTSVNNVLSDSHIRIYVVGHNVRIVGAEPGSTVVMTNVSGKELFRDKIYEIDVIDAGVYLVTVAESNGVYTFKILVK